MKPLHFVINIPKPLFIDLQLGAYPSKHPFTHIFNVLDQRLNEDRLHGFLDSIEISPYIYKKGDFIKSYGFYWDYNNRNKRLKLEKVQCPDGYASYLYKVAS